MKDNARHKHCIGFEWREMCVANTTNTNMKLYVWDGTSF